MKLTRTLKRLISLSMIGMLFFAQMATAAYVCPLQAGTTSSQLQVAVSLLPAVTAMADMPGCEGMETAAMDTDSPGLCHAYCHSAAQSDQTPTVKLPVVTFSSLPFMVLPATPMALLGPATPARPQQRVGTSPPLSVLYCCFRI